MNLIELLKVIFLGIVEGITEWLPVSSTGHMILVDEFIQLNVSEEFMTMFLVVIQLGAILAVVCLYFHKLNPFSPKKTTQEKKDTFSLWFKVIIACLPAAIIGVPLDDIITEYFYNPTTISITLIFYGIVFIVMERKNKNRRFKIDSLKDLTYKTALMIGIFQLLSLIPGTSRSGATIIGGMLVGTSRYVATEFTFFLAIPVMFGASLLKIVKFGFNFTSVELQILIVGMVVSFVVSIITIKFLLNYIKKNSFEIFGYYRIIIGCLVFAYFVIF